MAVARRFTVGTLLAVVFLVAADFAIVRALLYGAKPLAPVAIITLPMTNLLLLTMPRLRLSNRKRDFWCAFHAAGWTTVATSEEGNWCRFLFPKKMNWH